MNFSRTGNRALDINVSLIVAGGQAFHAARPAARGSIRAAVRLRPCSA
jgi:hypothetical protein